MSNLENNYKLFEQFLSDQNLSDKDTLLFIANYFLKNISKYEDLDKVYAINEEPLIASYDNFSLIKQALELSPDSFPLELAKISHNLLYLYNKIHIMDQAIYGKSTNK